MRRLIVVSHPTQRPAERSFRLFPKFGSDDGVQPLMERCHRVRCYRLEADTNGK